MNPNSAVPLDRIRTLIEMAYGFNVENRVLSRFKNKTWVLL
jgi:hypothetical protein